MKVSELIAFLQTQPQDLTVIYEVHSEMAELETKEIQVVEACEPRPDGWIQRQRNDKPTQKYLCFPGN